jgi:hypothetical protein
MTQLPPHDPYHLLNISKFLIPNDDDDRLLDLIPLPFKVYNHVDTDSDSEPELNTFFDNEFYNVVDKDNITFGTTNRGRRELYMCEYSYQVKEENATTTRWRCIVRTPRCPVTIHTNNIDNSFSHWNGIYHHHPPNNNRELIKSLIAKIKARVLVEPYPVVSIAEEEIRYAKLNRTQLIAMPLPIQLGMWSRRETISHFFCFFNLLESTLQKHRRKHIPTLPLSLDFEIPLLYQRTWYNDQFIIADIKRKKVGGRLIMFGSNEQIDLLLNSTVWFCDGTFKTRPLLFEQVYIIQCLVGDEGILK